MDNQGFTGSGFTMTKAPAVGGVTGNAQVANRMATMPKGIKISRGEAAAVRTAQAPAAMNGRIAANDVVGALRPEPQDAQEKKIQGLRKFQGRADSLWMGEFVGSIGGGALGWVATKTNSPRFGAVVKAIFAAPFEALRETKLNELHRLPANYMNAVSKHAAAIGGKANGMAESAKKRAASLEASGAKFASNAERSLAPVATPIKNGIRSGLNAFEVTAVGQKLLGGMQKGANWFAKRNAEKNLKHLANAETALTHEMPGFFGKVKGIFSGGAKPKYVGTHAQLEGLTTHLTNARSAATTAERVAHMELARIEHMNLARGATGDLASRLGDIGTYIEKSNGATQMMHHFEAAESKNMAGILKAVGKAAGRIPLFGAIIGVGAVAGVSATLMSHKHENTVAAKTRADIANAIGRDNPLMRSIDAAYAKGAGRRLAKTGFAVVGDVANAAMGMTAHGGGMAIMGAGMLPMVGSMLVKENPLLNAYANLRLEETQGVKLAPEVKLTLIRQLVASVPAVKVNGGMYNRLTLPVAEAIMDQNLSANETMKLLGNDQKFSALATEVLEKQKAGAAAVAASAPKEVTGTHAVGTAVAPAATVSTSHLMAASPSISAATIENHGRVHQQQKAASV